MDKKSNITIATAIGTLSSGLMAAVIKEFNGDIGRNTINAIIVITSAVGVISFIFSKMNEKQLVLSLIISQIVRFIAILAYATIGYDIKIMMLIVATSEVLAVTFNGVFNRVMVPKVKDGVYFFGKKNSIGKAFILIGVGISIALQNVNTNNILISGALIGILSIIFNIKLLRQL